MVIDLTPLNALTDVSKYHFPLLPVQVLILRTNGKFFSTRDHSTAYHQFVLTPETQKLVHFFVRNEQYKNKRGFWGLKALPGFFTRRMTVPSAQLVKRNEIITYIVDVVVQAENKPQMFERLRNFHEALRNFQPKAAPGERFFYPNTVKFLGHIITQNKMEPILNKTKAIRQMNQFESEKDVMKLLGALNHYCKNFLDMQIILSPLYNSLHDDVPFHRNEEQESVFIRV